GVPPVPGLQDPVPFLPFVTDDDAIPSDFDVYHRASLLAMPCGLTIRMIMTRSKAEKFMNRGSPKTKDTKEWVKPTRKLAMMVPLIFPSPPRIATRMAVVM